MSEEPAPPTSPVITVPVPQADRQLLALHALRQRQIRTSFLHGRRRTWRDRRRIWPAVVIALALVALIIAGTSVVAAFQRQQQVEAERTGRAAVDNATIAVGARPDLAALPTAHATGPPTKESSTARWFC